MNGESKRVKCAYCGVCEGTTKDHVPPKALFEKPYPINMITVPACKKCHDSISIDDEYFLIALGVVLSIGNSSHARYLTDKVKRALKRTEARKLLHDLKSRVRKFKVYSEGGIYLGDSQGIKFDWPRLKSFAARILKGLYFREYEKPLDGSYQQDVYLSWLRKDDDSLLHSDEVKELMQHLANSEVKMIGNKVLQYWFSSVHDDIDSSFWYVRIAEEFGFFGFLSLTQEQRQVAYSSHEMI